MSSIATVNFTLQYTPPVGPVSSGTASLSATIPYDSQAVGNMEVPSGTAPGQSYAIPMPSIGSAKLVLLRNLMSSEVLVTINGSAPNAFSLPPGGSTLIAGVTASGTPVVSITVVTSATPTVIETIQYFVFSA